jgi:hypothetical protein
LQKAPIHLDNDTGFLDWYLDYLIKEEAERWRSPAAGSRSEARA